MYGIFVAQPLMFQLFQMPWFWMRWICFSLRWCHLRCTEKRCRFEMLWMPDSRPIEDLHYLTWPIEPIKGKTPRNLALVNDLKVSWHGSSGPVWSRKTTACARVNVLIESTSYAIRESGHVTSTHCWWEKYTMSLSKCNVHKLCLRGWSVYSDWNLLLNSWAMPTTAASSLRLSCLAIPLSHSAELQNAAGKQTFSQWLLSFSSWALKGPMCLGLPWRNDKWLQWPLY